MPKLWWIYSTCMNMGHYGSRIEAIWISLSSSELQNSVSGVSAIFHPVAGDFQFLMLLRWVEDKLNVNYTEIMSKLSVSLSSVNTVIPRYMRFFFHHYCKVFSFSSFIEGTILNFTSIPEWLFIHTKDGVVNFKLTGVTVMTQIKIYTSLPPK